MPESVIVNHSVHCVHSRCKCQLHLSTCVVYVCNVHMCMYARVCIPVCVCVCALCIVVYMYVKVCVYMCMYAHVCIPVLCVCALCTCCVYVCGSVCVVARHSHIRKDIVFLMFSLQWEKHLTAAAMQKG